MLTVNPAAPNEAARTVLGISFDGASISGTITEFIKLVRPFADKGFTIKLDLGYDIALHKDIFLDPYTTEQQYLPSWVKLTRLANLPIEAGYTPQFLEAVFTRLIQQGENNAELLQEVDRLAQILSDLLVADWEAHNVEILIVENGTLPENIVFTKALYLAIEAYGQKYALQKFVLWHDHDLMWNSEPWKYGVEPFPNVPKPSSSPYIYHTVVNQFLLEKIKAWAPDALVSVFENKHNFQTLSCTASKEEFLTAFNIPENTDIIASCRRIIPPKRIDRDIYLLAHLKKLYKKHRLQHKPFLFIAGNIHEDYDEYLYLQDLCTRLHIEKDVLFANALLPYEDQSASSIIKYSTRDLLAHASLCSYLTSYHFESFGNPIMEAIAAKIPYLTTSFNLYDIIYGSKGLLGLILPIAKNDMMSREDDLTHEFILQVFDLLTNKRKYQPWLKTNYQIAKKLFSLKYLEKYIQTLFGHIMGERLTQILRVPTAWSVRLGKVKAPISRQI